ncbi:MAG: YicC/YloC family endoribonuclease, partial [Lautropia sp.]|nr:YicC/YloC family endoribonuclease [Lautropia sp.]
MDDLTSANKKPAEVPTSSSTGDNVENVASAAPLVQPVATPEEGPQAGADAEGDESFQIPILSTVPVWVPEHAPTPDGVPGAWPHPAASLNPRPAQGLTQPHPGHETPSPATTVQETISLPDGSGEAEQAPEAASARPHAAARQPEMRPAQTDPAAQHPATVAAPTGAAAQQPETSPAQPHPTGQQPEALPVQPVQPGATTQPPEAAPARPEAAAQQAEALPVQPAALPVQQESEASPARPAPAAQQPEAPPARPGAATPEHTAPQRSQPDEQPAVQPPAHEATPATAPASRDGTPARRRKPGTEIGSPVHSMTGYAHHSADTAQGRITIEVRAVNSRFLDLHFR